MVCAKRKLNRKTSNDLTWHLRYLRHAGARVSSWVQDARFRTREQTTVSAGACLGVATKVERCEKRKTAKVHNSVERGQK
eukprot:4711530-Pleurochrysis_carterae.AAC.4